MITNGESLYYVEGDTLTYLVFSFRIPSQLKMRWSPSLKEIEKEYVVSTLHENKEPILKRQSTNKLIFLNFRTVSFVTYFTLISWKTFII